MTIKTPDTVKTTPTFTPPDFGLRRTISGHIDNDKCSHGVSSYELCLACKNVAINAIARIRATSVSNTD